MPEQFAASDDPQPAFISKQIVFGRYLYVDLTPSADTDFTLVCAGMEECSPGYHLERDGFMYYAMEYVTSGTWELEANGEIQAMRPGSIFTYTPETVYTLKATGEGSHAKYFVDFSGKSAKEQFDVMGLAPAKSEHFMQTRWINDLFEQLLACASLSKKSAREIGTHLTRLLLMRVREDFCTLSTAQTLAHNTYLRCRQYIQANFTSLQTIDAVAVACHLDAAYLSRLFKKFGKDTPYHFLIRLKMDHATNLLLRQRVTVRQAALAVGFSDPYHFSRVFKSVHGMSPRKFIDQVETRAMSV